MTLTRDQELLLMALRRAGEARQRNRRDAKVVATRITELALKALHADVPLLHVAEAVGVSRQTIYTLTGHE